jgi:hypothetical protein
MGHTLRHPIHHQGLPLDEQMIAEERRQDRKRGLRWPWRRGKRPDGD